MGETQASAVGNGVEDGAEVAAVKRRERPLSPHLQIYRPQLTSVLSVFHRATGIALSAGAVVLVVWVVAVAVGGPVWDWMSWFLDSWVGRFVLMGWSWSLMYHLCTGIRHLLWDHGRGLDLNSVYLSGYVAVAVSTVLTALVWFAGFFLASTAVGI